MMESGEPPFIVVLVAVAVLIFVVIMVARDRSNSRKQTLRRIASRVGGTFIDRSFFSEPSLELTLAGRRAHLEFFGGSKNRSPYSQVVVDLRGVSPGSLHIQERGFLQAILNLFGGGQDLEIGDPSFDKQYVIKATPGSLAPRLFRRDRRPTGIRIVRRIQSYVHPTFDLNPQTATVKVRQSLRAEADLMTLIDTAREFVDFVVSPAAPAGIVLEEVTVAAEGVCPVCGTAMKDRILRCEECRTPHHAECWEYMGRCSTYACKGTRGVA